MTVDRPVIFGAVVVKVVGVAVLVVPLVVMVVVVLIGVVTGELSVATGGPVEGAGKLSRNG